MLKNIKGELFKISKLKYIYISIFLILFYMLFIFYLYRNALVIDLYNNFFDEVFYLNIILVLYYSSIYICDDLEYNIVNYLDKKYFLFIKIIDLIIYLIYIIIIELIFLFIYSLMFYGLVNNCYLIFNNILYDIPLLLFIEVLSILLSLIIKKSNIVMIILIIYLLSSIYLINYLININKLFKYLYIFYFRYAIIDSLNINILTIYLLYFGLVLTLVILAKYLIKQLRYLR